MVRGFEHDESVRASKADIMISAILSTRSLPFDSLRKSPPCFSLIIFTQKVPKDIVLGLVLTLKCGRLELTVDALGVRKAIYLAIAVILAAICCVALPGCGEDDEAAAEACINDAVETAKAATSAEDAPPNLLPGDAAEYGSIDVSGVLSSYYSKFSCSVDDVTVDGDKARARVSAKLFTLDQCLDMQTAALSEVLGSPVPTNDWTCLANGEMPDLQACVNAYEPLLQEAAPKEVSAEVDLKRFDGKWEVDTPYKAFGASDGQALIFLLQNAS